MHGGHEARRQRAVGQRALAAPGTLEGGRGECRARVRAEEAHHVVARQRVLGGQAALWHEDRERVLEAALTQVLHEERVNYPALQRGRHGRVAVGEPSALAPTQPSDDLRAQRGAQAVYDARAAQRRVQLALQRRLARVRHRAAAGRGRGRAASRPGAKARGRSRSRAARVLRAV